jgi:hypothetical protein
MMHATKVGMLMPSSAMRRVVLCRGSEHYLKIGGSSRARLAAEGVINMASVLSLVVYGFRVDFPLQAHSRAAARCS